MLDRIQLLIKSKNLTASKFADEIGVQRSGISHLLSGRNKPSLEFIQKILSRFPELRIEWLINGSGPMYKELQLFHTDVLAAEDLNKSDIPELNEEIIDPTEVTDDIFEEDNTDQVTDNVIDDIPKKDYTPTLNKSIEKIVVFYSDKTFSEYKPE